MSRLATNPTINYQLLKEFQTCFQKDLNELITYYLLDAKKKLALFRKALENRNLELIHDSARELRLRSIDVGAIQFSHACLSLELSVQEMRLEHLETFIQSLETQFQIIESQLLEVGVNKHLLESI